MLCLGAFSEHTTQSGCCHKLWHLARAAARAEIPLCPLLHWAELTALAAQSQEDLGQELFAHRPFICGRLPHSGGIEGTVIHSFPAGVQVDRLMLPFWVSPCPIPNLCWVTGSCGSWCGSAGPCPLSSILGTLCPA